MKYSKQQLQEALADFEEFIEMTQSKGTPIRLLIVRDLLEKEIMLYNNNELEKDAKGVYNE